MQPLPFFLFSCISGKIKAAYFEKFGKLNEMPAAERAADATENQKQRNIKAAWFQKCVKLNVMSAVERANDTAGL